MTIPRASPRSSTSTSCGASTASWKAMSRSTPSATKRGGTRSSRGSRCTWSPRATSTSPSRAGDSTSPKVRPSTPRTATNLGLAERASCCSPAAGRPLPNGPTGKRTSAKSSRSPSRRGLRPKRGLLSDAMLYALVDVVNLLLTILTWVIIIQVVLSWLLVLNVLNTSSQGVRTVAMAIDRLTAPLYRPIRRILPDFGGIDFSPLVVLILIQIIKKLLAGVVAQYYFGG